MVDGCESIQFVQSRDDAAVFDIREPANVDNEVWPPSPRGQLKTGAFYIPIRQPKSFTRLPQTKTGYIDFPRAPVELRLFRLLQNYHSVKNSEQRLA